MRGLTRSGGRAAPCSGQGARTGILALGLETIERQDVAAVTMYATAATDLFPSRSGALLRWPQYARVDAGSPGSAVPGGSADRRPRQGEAARNQRLQVYKRHVS